MLSHLFTMGGRLTAMAFNAPQQQNAILKTLFRWPSFYLSSCKQPMMKGPVALASLSRIFSPM